MKTTRIQGLAFALLAAVFAAFYDILTRFCASGITPWQILLARAILGLAVCFALTRALGLNLLGKNRAGMLFVALTLVGGVICFIFALFRLPVFEAVLLLYLYPVFGALFSPFLVNERMGPRLWGLIVVAFCGTAFILWPQDLAWGMNWGHLLGIGAGLAHGLALTLVRRYSPDNSPLTPFFYFCAVGAVMSVGAVGFGAQAMELSPGGLWALAGIAVTAGLAQLCMLKSAACITSAEVGIIGMSEIVFGGVLSFLFFDEAVGLRQLCGGILVISSGVVLALDTARDVTVGAEPACDNYSIEGFSRPGVPLRSCNPSEAAAEPSPLKQI